MGSLEEEEKLIQMVNEFIESDSPTSHYSASSKCMPLNNQIQIFTLQVCIYSLILYCDLQQIIFFFEFYLMFL